MSWHALAEFELNGLYTPALHRLRRFLGHDKELIEEHRSRNAAYFDELHIDALVRIIERYKLFFSHTEPGEHDLRTGKVIYQGLGDIAKMNIIGVYDWQRPEVFWNKHFRTWGSFVVAQIEDAAYTVHVAVPRDPRESIYTIPASEVPAAQRSGLYITRFFGNGHIVDMEPVLSYLRLINEARAHACFGYPWTEFSTEQKTRRN